tara:strand:- start:9686 stop:10024 length:339 start_codon:yes stop_codon:yes gene_type:complete
MNDKKIYIGNFDIMITIYKSTRVQSETGSPVETDVEILKCWASKEYKSTNKELDNQIVAANFVEYSIYFHPDLERENIQDLIIDDNGRKYEIFGFEPVGREQFYILNTQLRE